MPRTKLAQKVDSEKQTEDNILSAIKKLETKGPLVQVPSTPFSVDLLTGVVYLSKDILERLRDQHNFKVDKQ